MICREYGAILTSDPELQRVIQTAINVASSKATVLISGESGTGKELLAKYIHEKSPRAGRKFVAINCAAVPEGLLESELFGYERGAFTGAGAQKIGKFELASDSTILLDEISEMPLTLQAKLLRVLQEEEIDRLGGRHPIKVNIRVIATTNKDLRKMITDGTFREDLYYRLNVIPLKIPALRERQDDIVVLANHFLKMSAIFNSRPMPRLTPGAVELLKSHSWPGNVREIENVMERAVLVAVNNEITEAQILIEKIVPMNQQSNDQGNSIVNAAGVTIAEMEKQLIFTTLQHTGQNRTHAAKMLGISIRTLRNKLNEYKLEGVSNG